ncbi:MAG: hypothetical protein ABIK98_08755, partial [Pseudomonadota bacterium]
MSAGLGFAAVSAGGLPDSGAGVEDLLFSAWILSGVFNSGLCFAAVSLELWPDSGAGIFFVIFTGPTGAFLAGIKLRKKIDMTTDSNSRTIPVFFITSPFY